MYCTDIYINKYEKKENLANIVQKHNKTHTIHSQPHNKPQIDFSEVTYLVHRHAVYFAMTKISA